MTEEEVKEDIKENMNYIFHNVKESLMLLKKELERFEKKGKKNGKLTQKEEEEKKGVIEMINEMNAEMNKLNAEMNELKLKKKGGKKDGKKGDSESGEVREDDASIETDIVRGHELTEKELKELKRKQKKERLRLLKKKLEKLEKKSKKNGKLTQKEEEVKEMVIEKIDYLESNATPLLQIGTDMEGGKWKIKKDGKTTQEEEEKKGENHPVLSGEPLECGQIPPMRKRSPGAICRKIGFHIWGFVDGKCQEFIRGSCGTKIPGFASKDECQRACGPKKIELKKGQDYKCPTGNPYDCKL